MQGAGFWWGVGLLLLLGAATVYYYNRLVFNRHRVAEAWSGIDVQLKRRSSLIPALVECVRQYMSYEQGALQALVQERMRAVQLADSPLGQRAPVEAQLGSQLRQLFALVEAYPELKADSQFRELQGNISEVENHIQMARRYYNGAVRELNVLVESVPSNLLARLFGFAPAEYFSLDDPNDGQSPKMEF
ncbi:LemA family protein [Ectopseudomonas hydrolytica]|jgi:LemA protein|uniref:LemA family protein n=1 Tax=Ectopseudomonas hydrolytica TaxID=2493633 RepID=UPI0003076505|nr:MULTISPECIES: LemA family protein [Pseudomonas]ARS51219.1 membrane protein [Pseudomonas mendocina]ATH79958.1 LemA family protein [Pseudomonas mendocina]MBF8163040.1 LemA family protein [Pseudomonas mendocina]UTH31643.1 LemA family protein [Pseudomonas hydrolytica]UTH36469.1 LemA family protein [Pseudomonas sp. KHPS1]